MQLMGLGNSNSHTYIILPRECIALYIIPALQKQFITFWNVFELKNNYNIEMLPYQIKRFKIFQLYVTKYII